MNNSTHFLNYGSLSSGRNHRREAPQRQEINADTNLQTKTEIRIRRIVML